MALQTLKELLLEAKKEKYGVIAANPFNFDSFQAVLAAAEEERSPIILQVCDKLFKYFNFERLMPPIIEMAKCSCVPVAVNLDHGENLEIIMRSIRAGVSSVMFDGSILPLEENISVVKNITNMAHAINVSVEGEVGIVRGYEAGSQALELETKSEHLTRVEDAVRFTRETNVDALAIAVGTAHGVYKSVPKIDFERIKEINRAVETPLVLHGGSGLPDVIFQEAIACGITKINYFTDLVIAATKKINEIVVKKDSNNYMEMNYLSMQAIKEDIRKKLVVFGSSGKA